MNRWWYILLGGDISSPAFRRMLWRLGVPSFFLGMYVGYAESEISSYDAAGKAILGAVLLAYAALVAYESVIYYLRSDEMLRRLLVASLAISGLVIVNGLAVYSALIYFFNLPEPETIHLAFISLGVVCVSWFIAASRST